MPLIVSPSILSCDFSDLRSELKKIEASSAKWIHLDIMDGHFVPNITFGSPVIKSIRSKTDLFFDTHLMITEPERYIEDFAVAGSDCITFHYEASKENSINVIKQIKNFGIKAGISIKPNTRAQEIEWLLEYLDLVLVMTVEPGFSGQSFIEEASEKIKFFKDKVEFLAVDGGINDHTGKICKNFGANVLVSGNYLFKSEDFNSSVLSLI